MSRQRVLVILAFGVMVMTAGGALAALAPAEAGIPLASLPQGGSAHEGVRSSSFGMVAR